MCNGKGTLADAELSPTAHLEAFAHVSHVVRGALFRLRERGLRHPGPRGGRNGFESSGRTSRKTSTSPTVGSAINASRIAVAFASGVSSSVVSPLNPSVKPPSSKPSALALPLSWST